MVTGIIWVGPVFDRGGYGNVSRNYVLGLHRLGIPVKTVNWGEAHPEIGPATARLFTLLQDTDVGPEPALVVHSIAPGFQAAEQCISQPVARRIGCTIFETDRIPPDWVESCNRMDEIWVPSQFNRETFAGAGVQPDKLRVIPYGVDTRIFTPTTPAAPFRFDSSVKSFKFLYTLALDYRKGLDRLLEAYCNEFTAWDDVALVLKVYIPAWFTPADRSRPFNLESELKRSTAGKVDWSRDDLPQLVLLNQLLTQEELLGLNLACDAYVSTDRANGWGVPCQEMMALGKPAATINWSGSTEFMNEHNSFLIQPTGRLIPVDERLQRTRPAQYKNHQWAEVTVEEVRGVLRSIFSDRKRREQIAARALQDVRTHYTVEKVAHHIVDALHCRRQTPAAVQPNSSDATHRHVAQLFQEERYQEAAALLSQTLLAQETSDGWNDWATAQLARGRPREAEQGYRRALELDSLNNQAAANLGILLVSKEKFGEAIPFLEQSATSVDEQQRAVIAALLAECRKKQEDSTMQTASNKTDVQVQAPTPETSAQTPSNGLGGNITKLILDTLTQHAEAIGVITTRLLALQSQLDEMAGHAPAEPNQTSARPVPLS